MKNSVLHFKNVSKKYYKNQLETNALECINLEIPKGSIYGIIGNNGAGKSTLFRCVIGLEELDQGSIYLDGEEIPYGNPAYLREARKEIGVVFQQLNLFTSRTVEENISYPLEVYGVPIKERKSRIDETISLMGLKEKRKKYPSQLSGGERQRVAIGRAIVNRPKILLCDEATSALDSQTFVSIIKLLKNLNEHLGITILAITHQSELVKHLCTHVAFLKGGCIEKHGPKHWILSKSADKNSFVTEFIGGISS